jgi:hypothetical protein
MVARSETGHNEDGGKAVEKAARAVAAVNRQHPARDTVARSEAGHNDRKDVDKEEKPEVAVDAIQIQFRESLRPTCR